MTTGKAPALGGARERLAALLLLAVAAWLCTGGPLISALGFYRDDWLCLFVMKSAGSWREMFRLMSAQTGISQRPFDVPELMLAYGAFGARPLGWHVLLAAIGALTSFCVWRVLRAYRAPEPLAALGALLFLAYPSKDTALFWAGYINGPLALLGFLAGLLAHLDYVASGRKSALAAAVAAFAFSLGTYDSCLFLAPVLLLTPSPAAGNRAPARARFSFACLCVLTAVSAGWKLLLMRHNQAPSQTLFSSLHAVSVYVASVNANLGPDLLLSAARAAAGAFARLPLTASAAFLLPCLVLLAPESAPDASSRPALRRLIFLGASVYALGYLPVAVSQYFPAPTDVENRLNLVPAAGLVLACVGALSLMRSKAPRYALALAAGLASAASTGFAGAWAASYARQLDVRDLVLRHLNDWPREDALFLLQPELNVDGRAPVFDDAYIIDSAVHFWTGDEARRSYVVRPGVEFLPDGLHLDGKAVFPYNRLVLLDAASGALTIHPAYDFIRRVPIPENVHNPVASWLKRRLGRAPEKRIDAP